MALANWLGWNRYWDIPMHFTFVFKGKEGSHGEKQPLLAYYVPHLDILSIVSYLIIIEIIICFSNEEIAAQSG